MLTHPTRRILLRAAQRIHEHLVHRQQYEQPVALPEVLWRQLHLSVQRLSLAQERGWRAAAARLTTDVDGSLARLMRPLEDCRQRVRSTSHPSWTPSTREIFQDLVVLDEEFEEVRCNLKERALSVVTDSITFEGIGLGRFEIVMPWEQSRSYAVVALDPNPAATNSSVTHPHVQAERLCEGDGRAAITQALSQGRFLDFFLLVRQMLHTYGEHSAYVSLDRWYGRDCQDCGQLVPDDESTTCERCDNEICYECCSNCHGCGGCCCSQCRGPCQGCEEDCCTNCLSACQNCEQEFCAQCLTGEQCHDCQESEEEHEESDAGPLEGTATEEAADASLHPICLGEAIVLA